MADLKIVVTGAGGRMGATLINSISQTKGLVLHGALERVGAECLGQDAGLLAGLGNIGISISDNVEEVLSGADGIVDFTVPAVSVALASEAAKRDLLYVVGTTGCAEADEQAFLAAADAGARIIKSGNMSLGVNLLEQLVRQAAAALGDEFDIEVVEMHHNQKVDAPSGTALMLGEAAAKGREIDLETNAIKSREGITGVRKTGTIGFATLRGGTVVGEHSVIFAGPGERIEITHRAQDRSLFANGAIKALLWGANQPAGLYSMADVLGLNTK